MKKFLTFILSLIFMLSPLMGCVTANAAYDSLMNGLGLYSECIYLKSLDNGAVIFEKNADMQTHPASLTKIVTAAVVIENCPDLEKTITVKESCIRSLDGTGSSMGGLKADEVISIDNLLHYLLIHSANEAAVVLADYVCGGNVEAFIAKMNDLAAKLGCVNTHFVNPHGLDDDDQYTTARDIATLAEYALKYDAFAEIVSKSTYTVPETNKNSERKLYNTNYLMNSAYKEYYCKYASGVKTGSTSVAGKCVVSTASYNGYKYIAAALKAPFEDIDNDGYQENGAFLDCKKMFEWSFKNIELVSVADKSKVIAEVPVKLSWSKDYVTLSPKEESYELVPVGTGAGSLLIVPDKATLPGSLNAPVKQGDVICTAHVMYAGQPIAEVELVANYTVRRSVILFIGSIIKKIISTAVFKVFFAAFALAVAVIFGLHFKNKKKKNRAKNIIVLNRSHFKGIK